MSPQTVIFSLLLVLPHHQLEGERKENLVPRKQFQSLPNLKIRKHSVFTLHLRVLKIAWIYNITVATRKRPACSLMQTMTWKMGRITGTLCDVIGPNGEGLILYSLFHLGGCLPYIFLSMHLGSAFFCKGGEWMISCAYCFREVNQFWSVLNYIDSLLDFLFMLSM